MFIKKQLILILFISSFVQAQNTSSVRNLIFEGAGIRGVAYSGAIRELEKRNILQTVQRVGGTSAGAVIALTLSLGYAADEITTLIGNTSFKKFNDRKFFFIGGINRLNKYYGWYRGQQFEKWLSKLIEAKTHNADITFGELHQQGFKDLYVTGTCLNRQSLVIFSHENYPGMKVKDAIRISSSIPLYFEAVFIDRSGKAVHHPKNRNSLDLMADGGFIANFPIKLFDSTKYFDTTLPNEFAINPQTIGFRIDREEQIINDTKGRGLAPMDINNLNSYLGALYNMVMENLNRQTLTREDWQRTISISDESIAPRIRKLQQEEVQLLIQNGSSAVAQYFFR